MASSPKFSDSSHTLLWKLALCCTEGGGGGGGGGVSSFNGRTGAVVLTFADVADALGCEPECVANKSTDGTFAANSDVLYPSQKAAKTYADTKLALTGGVLTGDLDISTGIHLDTTGDAQFDGQVTAERLLLTGATFAVAAERLIDASVTWAGPGQIFTAWKLDVTNTFSHLDSLLLDLQVGGVSQFSVGRAGDVVAIGDASFAAGQILLNADGTASFLSGATYLDSLGRLVFAAATQGGVFHTDDSQELVFQAGSGLDAPDITLSGPTAAISGSVQISAGTLSGGIYLNAGGSQLSMDITGELLYTGPQVFFLAPLNMQSHFITDVLNPVNPQDAATKAYVDAAVGGSFQPLDPDLTAIAALATTGFSARTAANTWALRTITGTANQITVTNGDGVAGNPTLSLPASPILTGLTLSGFTQGSVIFAGVGGLLSQDNANFFWDDAANTLRLNQALTSGIALQLTKPDHSSADASAFRILDDSAQENIGLTTWTGGGGTGGYGALVFGATAIGSGNRFGEISAKENATGVRNGSAIIFQRGTSAATGDILIYGGSGGSFNIGLIVNANGRVGVRHGIQPTAHLHLAAGTTAASTAPLKFISGSLNTTAEAGAVEFLTDKWHATITTGAARKELTLNDIALTSGRVPFVTTNGRLTDSSLFVFSTSTGITLGAKLQMTVAQVFAVATGSDQRAGNATLVAGTVTVANTTVTANTLVMLTRKTSGGTLGTAITYTLSAGTSFTINSDSALDTSTFSYYLIENS